MCSMRRNLSLPPDLIGLGLILFLIYRPQGFLPEYRLKTKSLGRERPSASHSIS